MYILKNATVENKIGIGNLKYPTTIYLKLTKKCNLLCKFCSQSSSISEEMNFASAKKLLKKFKSIGIKNIFYTGGEPLLYSKIEEILLYGYNLGFNQYLITNGTLLDELMNVTSYLFGIGVSIHGSKLKHDNMVGVNGTYEKVINGLSKINTNLFVNVNCTITNENLNKKDLDSLYELCKINNWKLSFARLNYIGYGKRMQKVNLNHMMSILSKYEKINISNCVTNCVVDEKYSRLCHGCGAGVSIASIECNGDVKICSSSTQSIGNAFKNDFCNIWKKNKRLMKKQLRTLPLICTTCKNIISCKGGCKAESTGRYWEKYCDNTVLNKQNEIWNYIKHKKVVLCFSKIRKENINKYAILSHPIYLCNRNVKNIIMKISYGLTPYEIVSNKKNYQQIKDLLICMYELKLIKCS